MANNITLPPNLQEKIHIDADAIKAASTDYGHIITQNPAAVLFPTSMEDLKTLIGFSFNSSAPYTVAAKGRAHSVHGEAMATNGVVVEMTSLSKNRSNRIMIGGHKASGFYADVGGEQLWIDVLNATLQKGLTPVSWTDYLYLTVGGTLSNAGISGQTHLKGPQINNVYELDVVTGKGELVTCSKQANSKLFYAVLGGLGQFGIITGARIVKWFRMLYIDFDTFSKDQEKLMAVNESGPGEIPNFLEGQLLMDPNSLDFYTPEDRPRIASLIKQYGILYVLETASYYDDRTKHSVDKKLHQLFESLSNYLPNIYSKNVTYVEFLDRVHTDELVLRKKGLWEVPHPWLNLFIPKSGIQAFNNGVFKNILLKQNVTTSIVLVYPMYRNKWDDNMSAVIPDEEIFYTAGFLHSSGFNNRQVYDNINKEILEFCDKAGIKVKKYLGYQDTKEKWINHFGSKWKTFQDMKTQFDPKMILSPGQRIFN
ncbi:hypothetical protein Dsin_015185 [Dipteronia sinensis]|uniref:cytokinin dehydrogenase n=1 Tax=Dipteronia sinensis TaxID=43782 RepID=A0AAE0AB19_9ROSI|nr:hypothetical protein Dsin_015185 [Dipteronia sinensis]